MQVHRSKGVTTLKLTKRERDTLSAAHDIAEYVRDLPKLWEPVQVAADDASTGLEKLILALDRAAKQE